MRLHQYQCRNYQVNAGAGMKQNLFLHLLNAAKDVYSSSLALKEFAPWPTDLSYEDKPVVVVPAVRQIKHWSDAHPLHKARPNRLLTLVIGNNHILRMRSALVSYKIMAILNCMVLTVISKLIRVVPI